jgi:hypothetical protein
VNVAATTVEVPGSSRKAERPTAKTPVPDADVKATEVGRKIADAAD